MHIFNHNLLVIGCTPVMQSDIRYSVLVVVFNCACYVFIVFKLLFETPVFLPTRRREILFGFNQYYSILNGPLSRPHAIGLIRHRGPNELSIIIYRQIYLLSVLGSALELTQNVYDF